jgi:hypothetical protein
METAVLCKMPLQPPKRTAAGFFLALNPPVTAPAHRWTKSVWDAPTAEWVTWADTARKTLLGELLSHGAWFSRPPRHDVLDPLFSPWAPANMQGVRNFFCKTPATPGAEGSSGVASWQLQGLIMSSTSIAPVWTVAEFKEDLEQDTISLFGGDDDGDSVDEDSIILPTKHRSDTETREIEIEEVDEMPPVSGGAPTHIRSREWEARKFLAKERVREARLKAQIATHLARKEESRYYAQFGNLDDGESHFSDYDLTDEEGSGTDGESSDGSVER